MVSLLLLGGKGGGKRAWLLSGVVRANLLSLHRKFSGDEAFLTDPNAFNDKLNTGEPVPTTSAAADSSKL